MLDIKTKFFDNSVDVGALDSAPRSLQEGEIVECIIGIHVDDGAGRSTLRCYESAVLPVLRYFGVNNTQIESLNELSDFLGR